MLSSLRGQGLDPYLNSMPGWSAIYMRSLSGWIRLNRSNSWEFPKAFAHPSCHAGKMSLDGSAHRWDPERVLIGAQDFPCCTTFARESIQQPLLQVWPLRNLPSLRQIQMLRQRGHELKLPVNDPERPVNVFSNGLVTPVHSRICGDKLENGIRKPGLEVT